MTYYTSDKTFAKIGEEFKANVSGVYGRANATRTIPT